jgi:uncharacterized protein (DUF169 family)
MYMVKNMLTAEKIAAHFPRFEYGTYIGIASAPLSTANFKPDLVLVYSNTAQLRSLLLAIKYQEGRILKSDFDPIDSCVYSVVPSIKKGDYRITIPDPGEYERAMADEGEIILSIPSDKLKGLMEGLHHYENRNLGYRNFSMQMTPDFEPPAFYKDLFRMWGLDVAE